MQTEEKQPYAVDKTRITDEEQKGARKAMGKAVRKYGLAGGRLPVSQDVAPSQTAQQPYEFKMFAGFGDGSNNCGASCGASVEEFSRTANMVVGRVNTYVKAYCAVTKKLEEQLRALNAQMNSTTAPEQLINLRNNISLKKFKIGQRKQICDMLDQKWAEYNTRFQEMLVELKAYGKKKSKMTSSEIKKAELPLKQKMAALLSGLAHLTPRGDETEAIQILTDNSNVEAGYSKWTEEQANAVRLNAINMAANCGSAASGLSSGGSGCPIEGGPIEMDECTFDAAVKAARKCKASEEIPQVFKDFNTDDILKSRHADFVKRLKLRKFKTFPDILEYVSCNAAAHPLLFPTFMAAGRHVFAHLSTIMENTCEACMDTTKFKDMYGFDSKNKTGDPNFRAMFSTENMHKYLSMVKDYLHQLRYRMGKKNLKVMQEDNLLWSLAPNKPTDNCKNPYIRKLSVPSCEKDRIKNMLSKKAAEEACRASNQCASAVGVPAGLAALMPSAKSGNGASANSNACGEQKFTKRRVYHDASLNACGFGEGCVGGSCSQPRF